MAPLFVQCVTPGAKVYGTNWWCSPTYPSYDMMWHNVLAPPVPPCSACSLGLINPQLLQKEGEHIKQDVQWCKYPNGALNSLKIKSNHIYNNTRVHNNTSNNNNNAYSNNNYRNIHIMVPYTEGLSEGFKNICIKMGTPFHFKGGNNITNLLVPLRTRITSHIKVE